MGQKSKDYFLIAGVWQEWTDAETGETIDTCAMTTTGGNEITSQIHNSKSRMPTMLTEDLAWEWLFEKPGDKRITEIASYTLPWQEISYYTLAKDFLSSPDPWKEHFYPDLPPIILPGEEPSIPEGQLELF